MSNLEERKQAPGHYHLEGFCALKAGRTWTVTRTGCQATGQNDPNELPVYRTSLAMVRDYVYYVVTIGS